jgi:hypothetical protein
MSSEEIVQVAVKRAAVYSPECVVALAGLSGRNYRNDWKRANLEQTFESNSYFNANAEHRERIVDALFLMRQEAVFGSFEETVRRVLSPSEALPHQLHLGGDEWSYSDGILEYEGQQGCRFLQQDELQQLMRRLQAEPQRVTVLNLSCQLPLCFGMPCEKKPMSEMIQTIAALESLQVLNLKGTRFYLTEYSPDFLNVIAIVSPSAFNALQGSAWAKLVWENFVPKDHILQCLQTHSPS